MKRFFQGTRRSVPLRGVQEVHDSSDCPFHKLRGHWRSCVRGRTAGSLSPSARQISVSGTPLSVCRSAPTICSSEFASSRSPLLGWDRILARKRNSRRVKNRGASHGWAGTRSAAGKTCCTAEPVCWDPVTGIIPMVRSLRDRAVRLHGGLRASFPSGDDAFPGCPPSPAPVAGRGSGH
jgi:hypothetical protein